MRRLLVAVAVAVIVFLMLLCTKWFQALKMLGLHLYTLIIGHKSILNKLKLQKKLQTFVKNNVFLNKKK